MTDWILPISGGLHLEQLVGMQPDPHLLTAWLWHAIFSNGNYSRLAIANAAGLLLLCTAVAWIVGARRRILVGIIVLLLVLLSPFSVALVRDPLGGEALFAVTLFSLLAGALAEALTIPLAIECLLIGAIVLQQPSFVLAAVAFAIVKKSKSIVETLVRLGAVFVAFAVRTLLDGAAMRSELHFGLHNFSRDLGIVSLAVVLLLVMPAALFVGKLGLYRRSDLIGGAPWRTVLFSLAGLSGSIFGGSFDFSVHALAAECALLIPFGRLCMSSGTLVNIRFAALLALSALEIVSFTGVLGTLPISRVERESVVLRGALHSAALNREPVCLVGDDVAKYRLLAGGAFVRFNAPNTRVLRENSATACDKTFGTRASLVVASDGAIHDWGESGVAMVKAASPSGPGSMDPIPVDRGLIMPRRAVKGRDVFSTLVQTPMGRLPAFTILAGYRYRFDCLGHRRDQMLRFALANPLAGMPGTSPVLATVTIGKSKRGLATIFKRLIEPDRRQSPVWHYYAVRLPRNEQCRTITFAADAPAGSAIGAWATFLGARLTSS